MFHLSAIFFLFFSLPDMQHEGGSHQRPNWRDGSMTKVLKQARHEIENDTGFVTDQSQQ